jgi:TIR domain
MEGALAYLSSDAYDYDIFVSYAHVDDLPLPGAAQGWVTTFTTCLKTKLAQKLGRNDAYALWMDHELRGGQPITPHILEKVRRSAMLFVVLSPGYIASSWCRRELDTFHGLIAEGQARHVFVVELDPVEKAELPPALADLKRSRFWIADRNSGSPRTVGTPIPDGEYYSAVDDFIREVVTDLKQLKHAEPRPAVAPPPSGNGAVFLAEVTDDLDDQRNNVKRYLNQAGIVVFPKNDCSLEPKAFRQAVTEGLAEGDLFVQLLSAIPGKRPPDLPEGYVKCQLELAVSLGKPVLQWRNPALDVSSVQDAAQRALLDAATVRAEGIEDFKREIRRRLDERRNQPPRPVPTEAFVFVDMDSTDRPLAEQLSEILFRNGAGYMLPTEDRDPRKFRRDLRDKLLECNALILIYGATTRSWVDGHLRELQKMLTLRPNPLRGLAIVEGPPDPKDRLSIMLPKMKVINCRGGVQEAEVRRFLESLETQAS